MQKNWQFLPQLPKDFLKQFPEINSIILQLLYNRGLKSQREIDNFLSPEYEDLTSPFLFLDMEKAVNFLLKAVENQEKILIYGDYDADGVCASVILMDTLKSLGAKNIEVYLPYRDTEGYGLNFQAVKEIIKQKFELVITVDCGISNKKEIDLLNQAGIKVIITDHHYPPPELPSSLAILDPKLENETYPFKDLSGCGVVFKLIQAITSEQKNYDINYLPEGFEKWLLDLVAISVITDICPLLGENRILVKYGLIVLQKTKRIGLQELIKVMGRDLKQLDVNSVGFQIGPRLNAAGRVDHASTAYQLLITKDQKEAEKLAWQLNKNNQERQKLTDKVILEAKEILGKVSDQKILFVVGKNWPLGIIGLVAGKLTDEFFRPAVVISEDQNKELSGSARSTKKFNIIKAIKSLKDYLIKFGGHAQAAGFTLKKKNLGSFQQEITKMAKDSLTNQDIVSTLDIELEVNLEEINWEFYEKLKQFQPFGLDNPKPRFLAKKLKIAEIQKLGQNNQHLKLFVTQQTPILRKFIGFSLVNSHNLTKQLKIGDMVDIVFEVDENVWNNQKEIQLRIIDFGYSHT